MSALLALLAASCAPAIADLLPGEDIDRWWCEK